MKTVFHKADERGRSDLGWLQSNFSFSFADYYDPKKMGFGVLRVINDDTIAGGKGFGKHPHADMEIISIGLEGALSHEDSMGNQKIITAGEVQVMSAGTGVMHSEMNHNPDTVAKFLQIWIHTRERGVSPHYDQKAFSETQRKDSFQLLVSPDARNGSLKILQDAYISRISMSPETSQNYTKYDEKNGIYIFVIQGNLKIKEQDLGERDALGLEEQDKITLQARDKSDILIFEVPMI